MDELVPTIRDLRPYPESAEAIAQGCNCAVARYRGKPLVTKRGSPVFAIASACPVHDNPLCELPIWSEKSPIVSSATHAVAPVRSTNATLALIRPALRNHAPSAVPSSSRDAAADAGRNPKAFRHEIPAAHLPYSKSLDDFDFAGTGIDQAHVRKLHGEHVFDSTRNVIFMGATGTGKTHLALALAERAIQQSKRGRFYTAVDLVERLEHEHVTGKAGALSRECAQLDFMVIDELGYVPISKEGGALLFHLLARLHEKTSTILTTNLAFEDWAVFLMDAKIAAALLDRLMYRCDVVETGTVSWRLRQRALNRSRAAQAAA